MPNVFRFPIRLRGREPRPLPDGSWNRRNLVGSVNYGRDDGMNAPIIHHHANATLFRELMAHVPDDVLFCNRRLWTYLNANGVEFTNLVLVGVSYDDEINTARDARNGRAA